MFNNEFEESKKQWKKDGTSNTAIKSSNNSTLSLHISAYENSTDKIFDDSFNPSKTPKLKTTFKKWQMPSSVATAATLNLYEFPRQQQKDQEKHIPNPGIMQFKASQKLLNPNKSSLSNQRAMTSRRAPPRAYVTSAYQIDFHIEENTSIAAASLESITQFLISAGKVRQNISDKLKIQDEPSSSTEVYRNKDKLITIGLKQTLKAYNNKKLKWILLDSSTVSPSAVGQVMGLMATNGTKETKFYVMPELSSTTSKALNLPKISAIGFGSDCASELEKLFSNLHPIDIALKKKLEEADKQPSSSSTASSFVLPKLEVPKGKTKLSKKQKKKAAGGKKK